MGIILGKFRKKATTFEQLEKLDSQIKDIEEYGKTTEITQKKVAGRFVLVSVFVYVVTAITFYFYFFPATFYERMLYVIPLITAPLIIVSVKRILTWWYNRKLKKNEDKLSTLKEEKKKMLDKVMETETYKVAKKILEKFAPDEVITRKSLNLNYNSSNLDSALALQSSTPAGLRYRGGNFPITGRGSLSSVIGSTEASSTTLRGGKSLGNLPLTSTPRLSLKSNDMSVSATPNLSLTTPRLPMARTILPRERTAFDKLVDYLVGDGPSNRYALICAKCSSHNGMALREEFEYLSFHCCYCHHFNPARKQRPPAPKLGATRLSPQRALRHEDTSDSEKNSPSDSESDAQTESTLTTGHVQRVTGANRESPPKIVQPTEPPAVKSGSPPPHEEALSLPEVPPSIEDMEISEPKTEVELMETSTENVKGDEERD